MSLMAQYFLNKAGLSTLVIEQYEENHHKGSSHGETRAFHYRYFDRPKYIPYIKCAETLWRQIENESGIPLLNFSGKLEVFDSNLNKHESMSAHYKSHHIAASTLDNNDLSKQFPLFNFDKDQMGILEKNAGWLDVEGVKKAIAKLLNPKLINRHFNEKVIDWHQKNNNIIVQTTSEKYSAISLIITPGSWFEVIKLDLRKYISRIQKSLCWFKTTDAYAQFDSNSFPVFTFHLSDSMLYGFPSLNHEMKIARHTGGHVIEKPEHLLLKGNEAEEKAIVRFNKQYLNCTEKTTHRIANCLYTMTSDADFIIDRHPDYQNVLFATGFSGHGYKFSPAVGDMLINKLLQHQLEPEDNIFSCLRFNQ